MKNRGYIVGIVLFFAGLIGLWWLDYAHVPDRDAAKMSEGRVLPGLWEARPDDVQRVEIEGGPQRLAFERRPGNRWQMVEPVDAAADPSMVETLALNLKMLERIRDAGTLDESPSSYGLAPPVRTIRLLGRGGTKPLATLEIGSFATNRDKRYVRSSGSGGIEVIEARAVSAVEKAAESWRDRMLVRMPTFQVQSLDAHRADGRGLTVERQGDVWSLAKPFRAVADDGRVDGILAEVTGLRVPDGGFVADDVKDLATYGLETPMLTITLTPRGSDPLPQTIHIGMPAPMSGSDPTKTKGVRYYARRGDQDDVVIVDAGILQNLGANPLDLHGKKVANVQPERVDAIRLTSEGASVTVAKRAAGWERIEPLKDRADSAAVADLIKKVEAAQASVLFEPGKAPDPQVEKPWAVLEVWQDSGPKPGEGPESIPTKEPRLKLEIGRRDAMAKSIYARVAGDPVVMALPSSFLDGLTFGALAFRDRQVASASPPMVEKITVIRGPQAVVVEAPPDGNPARWRLKVPADAPGDPETVGRALTQLSNLRAESLVTDRPVSDEKYGLDKPGLVVKWKLRDESVPTPRRPVEGAETTLSVGAAVPGKPGPRFARVSSSPIVFSIGPEVVALFEAEWRDRTVFTLDPKSTERVTLRWPTLTLAARPVPDPKGGEPDWSIADPPSGLKLDQSQLKPMIHTLAKLATFRFAQHSGPIPPETGLFPARLVVEAQPTGQASPKALRIGRTGPGGYFFATTETGPSGAVFLLPMSNWAPWLNTPTVEKATPKAEAPAAKEAKPK